MNDINKEKDLSQENEEKLDSNLATIKSYLEANGFDSSWVEKSSYMRYNFSRGTSPFEYTVFYFDEKSNELKSRIKDVRGPSDKNSERKFTFYEYGKVTSFLPYRKETQGGIRATASKYLLPFAYGNAVKTSSLLC